MPKRVYQSKFLALSLIFSFILLITINAAPRNINHGSKEEFRPVVKVRQNQQEISESQKKLFKTLIDDGKKLLQEEMDYDGAISKFKEAQDLAITREQKADALFYLSLGYYATIAEKGDKEFNETIRKLLEIDYYRKLDELLCPPRYVQLFRGIKEEYGALRIQSKPPGADVYINDSKDPIGKTPVTIGTKAGTVKIKVKKGKQEKRDTLRVVAGETTTSQTYILKGKSSLIYVIGGIVLAGGVGAALLSCGKGNGGGTPTPSPGPTTGSVQVNSNPTGAQVFLDGNDTGKTTNTTLTDVSPGNHVVKLIKEGYTDYEESISVTAGQTTTVDATLTEIEAEGGYVFVTKWGSEGSEDSQFKLPWGIVVADYVYIADTDNHRVQKFTTDGTFITKWGSEGSEDGQFQRPHGITLDSTNNIFVADSMNQRIQKFTSTGTFVTKWGSLGSGDGQFDWPLCIAFDRTGNAYVLEEMNHRIQKFNSDGIFLAKWGSLGSGDGQFNEPRGMAADDFVYVADSKNNRIQKFTTDGTFVAKWGSEGYENGQFYDPRGMAVDSAGYVYVVDEGNHRIQKFNSSGTFVTKWGDSGSGDGQFWSPAGAAVDNSGNVYVVDKGNNRIQKFAPASAVGKAAEKDYSSLKNHFINRNLRPKSGLLNQPPRHNFEKIKRSIESNSRKNKKK